MRIAHFYGHHGENGVSWSIADVSRRLYERSHDVTIFCRMDSGLAHLPEAQTYRYLWGLHRFALRAQLRDEFRRRRIDILNVHSQRDAPIALQAAREAGVPTIYSCRELSAMACQYAPLADAVIAVSVGVGAYLRNTYAIHPPRLHVIPNGIDLAILPSSPHAALRAAQGFPAHEVWMGFLGRVVKNKNVTGLISAFAQIAARCPAARLIIIGGGRFEGQVRERVAAAQLTDRVRLTGWLPREAALPIVGALDALILPSRGAEGLSNAVLTAMAMGIPVLATNIPSLQGGPIRHGETGWLCTPNDATSLAEGLAAVACCPPATRQALGTAARAEIIARHLMSRVIDDLETAYVETAQAYGVAARAPSPVA